jgi:two-component system, LytTR family, response regulator
VTTTPAKIRTLVADDEPLARQRLRRLLDKEGDVDLVAECRDGPEAVAAFERLRPDLLLLDIRMPQTDGFGVIAALSVGPPPLVILVTAHREFALRAFEARAFDYLVKPFVQERFASVMVRVRDELRRVRDAALAPSLLALLGQPTPPRYLERLPIKTDARIQLVPAADIRYIAAEDNYARVQTGSGVHLVRDTLNGLEAALDPRAFLRIHRSLIVRLDQIAEVQPLFAGEYVVVLRDGTKLTSGRTYRHKLREALRLG